MFQDAQALHLPHHIILLNDPNAINSPLWLNFHQIDGDTHATQGNSRAEPANTAAHDQYFVYCHYPFSL